MREDNPWAGGAQTVARSTCRSRGGEALVLDRLVQSPPGLQSAPVRSRFLARSTFRALYRRPVRRIGEGIVPAAGAPWEG